MLCQQSNKYNMMVEAFPLQEILPGRPFFKKGEFFTHFYYLEEGRASIIINQVPIEVTAPIFLGDYQPLTEIDYRTTTIKAVSKCRIRILPLQMLSSACEHHANIVSAFEKYGLRSRVLKYWLSRLCSVRFHQRNDSVTCGEGIGIVLKGEFRLSSRIPIVRMKQPLQLLRRFEICAIGEHELFVEDLICESHSGVVGVIEPRYVSQLTAGFEQLATVVSVADSKRTMHLALSQDIARNCRKKRNLFQHMVPLTLQDSVRQEPISPQQTSRQGSQLGRSEQVFSVKDNITQFLHNQWRRGLSLKLPRKLKDPPLQTLRKRMKLNPEMISLSLPREFKEVKFNFKMLLKTKEHPFLRSRRLKTDPNQHPKRKLLFCD